MKTNTTAAASQWRGVRNWTMALVLLFAPLAATVRAQVTNVIYQDSFARTGLLNGSAPDTVDTGGAVWWASTNAGFNSALYTDGSEIVVTNFPNPTNGFFLNGFLPFTPQVGHVYTFSMSVYGIIGGNQWLALGYSVGEITNNYYAAPNCGAAWLLQRANNANFQPFLGPGTASGTTVTSSGTAVTNTYDIVLDTTTGTANNGWTVTWFQNGIQKRQAVYASGNPAIQYVGCGVDAATGYFQQFRLVDYTPPPVAPTILEQPQNVTVSVGQTATFWVNAAGLPMPTYQWMTNSAGGPTNAVAGATNAVYTTPSLTLSPYNGLLYGVVIANGGGSITSAPATLTVVSGPATVFSATKTASGTNVVVMFSEPVEPATGLNAGNYSLNNGASVLSASYGNASSNSVILLTSALDTNASYSLAVQNVQDFFGDVMTANTNIPVLPANLSLDLRADSGVVLDNSGLVDQWLDQTTNGNNAVQFLNGASVRPAMGTINGHAAISFNSASSNYLTAASSPSLAITNDMTIYVILKFADLSATREILSKTVGAQAAPYDYYANTGGNEIFYRGSGQSSAQVTSTAGASAGATHVLAATMLGTSVTHYLDGVANGSGILGAPTGIIDQGHPLWIGGRGDVAQWMSGQIAEILIFSSALSVADRATVDNYLGLKYYSSYAITTDLPASTTSSNGFVVTYTFAANWGSAHLGLQWQENGTNIIGANGASYTTPILSPSDNGDMFDVAVTLPDGSTIYSTTNNLTVLNEPPYVTSAGIPIWSTTNIVVQFDEAVAPATATVAANYLLNNGASVLSAVMGDAPNKVVLTTSALTWTGNPSFYALTVQNVQDMYGNTIVTASPSVGLYPPNVALWVKADTGVTTDAGTNTVNLWNDLSGNGNNLAQGTFLGFLEPRLQTNASGDTVLHFTGTNLTDGTALLANDSPSLEITGDISVIAVATFTVPGFGGGQGEIVSKTGAGAHGNIPAPFDYYAASGGAALYRGNGTTYGQFTATGGPSVGKPHIVAVSETGNTVSHFLDGRPVGSGVLNNSFQETNCLDQGQSVIVGGRGDFVNNHLTGDIAELIVVGSKISSSDLASLNNYLAARHNVVTFNTNPTNIVFAVTGNQLSFSWPADHTGWELQSNAVGLTATGAWFTVSGSTATNQVLVTPDATKTNVFFRMVYP